jgi:type II secretory pathway pseudopilin PulG
MSQNQFGNKKGISIIEILVVIAIIITALSSLLGLASFSLGVSTLIKQTNQGNLLSQEVMEAVRNFRDGTSWDVDGFGKLATSTDYYPQATSSPSKWQLVQGIENIDGFTRKVVFEDVMRDSNSNIVESGGTYNPNTKKVIVTVSWKERGREHKLEIFTYLTNWKQ